MECSVPRLRDLSLRPTDRSVVDIIVFSIPHTRYAVGKRGRACAEKNKYHSAGDVRSRHATFFFLCAIRDDGVADDENWVHAVIAADVDGRYFGLVCKRADCSRGGVSPPLKSPKKERPARLMGAPRVPAQAQAPCVRASDSEI
jgi:hypothetical protein